MAAPLPVNELITQDVVNAINAFVRPDGTPTGLVAKRPVKSALDPGTGDLSTYVWVDTIKSVPAPWGQLGWQLVLAIATYVREAAGDVPIDQRLLLAMSDVHRAVMADPRRNGKCYVDNHPLPPELVPSQGKGVTCVWSYLACEYRTLRSDPTVLAPAATNELLFQGGSSVLFAPDGGGRPLRLADMRITPLVEPMVRQATDDTNGASRVADEVVVGYRTAFEIDGENLSPQMMAWQLAGSAVGVYDQAGSPLVNLVATVAAADSVVVLRDQQGSPLVPIASVQLVTSPTSSNPTVYAPGTDYLVDADCLAEGFLKIPPGSTIPPGPVLVSLTPTAVAGRPAFDVAAECGFKGTARIVWRDAAGRTVVHGDFRASLVAQPVTEGPGRLAQTKLLLTVLDGGSASAGRVLYPAGSVPAVGY